MGTLWYLAGLATGITCTVWQWRTRHGGLEGLGAFIVYLLFCMPLTGILSGVFLFATGRQNGWPWTLPAGLMVLIAGGQLALGMMSADWRAAYVYMPLVLTVISAAELARGGGPLPATGWVRHSGPVFALVGLAIASSVYGRIAWVRHRDQEMQRQVREAFARKDQSLRGIGRAAWLLGLEFSPPEGYSEAAFARTGEFRDPRWGWIYWWDPRERRLHVQRGIFGDLSVYRPKLLPIADKARASAALRPGVRADLRDGVLQCSPPLECTLAWTIDVDAVKGDERGVRGKLDECVYAVELEIGREMAIEWGEAPAATPPAK